MKKVVLTFGLLSGALSMTLMFGTMSFIDAIGFERASSSATPPLSSRFCSSTSASGRIVTTSTVAPSRSARASAWGCSSR
jgi:hypothetical protein